MGLKKASKLIEKINVLHDSLLSIEDEISAIEKDLLLSYIMQLYDEVLSISTEDKRIYSDPTSFRQEVQKIEPERTVQVEKQMSIDDKSTAEAAPLLEEISIDNAVKTTIEQVEAVKTKVEEKINLASTKGSEEAKNKLVEMFEIKEFKELSEKLSNSPITDLSTAMGINDRFLTVNDLFAGDTNAFKECIDQINKMTSYDEAKSYLLSSSALLYDWSASSRSKKAASFISLVQRRFK